MGSSASFLDLSQLIHRDMIVWTNYPKPEVSIMKTFEKDDCFAEKVCIAIHVGTHVDVPIHYVEGKASVEQIPVDAFFGEALVLDVPVSQPDYQLNLDDLQRAMKGFEGQGVSGRILLFATGWDRHLGNEEMYIRSCPGFDKELAEYLVSLKVKAVGLDAPSLDYYKTRDSIAHKTLLGAGIVGFENLQGVTRLAGRRVRFYGLPLNLKGASGSPVRAIAEF